MADVEIKGLAELQRVLRELPVKIERDLTRGGLREGAKIIQAEAQARAAVRSGRLRASIKVRAGTKRGGRVYAQVVAGSRKAYWAHFMEFGTRPHEIRPKRGMSLFFAGLFRRLIKHPGTRPRPFMRTAFDDKAIEAAHRVGAFLRARLAKLGK